jgi:hypothetical protein
VGIGRSTSRVRRVTGLVAAALVVAVVAIAAADVVAAQAAPMPPVAVPGTWELLFNEEFRSAGLNTSIWTPGWQEDGKEGISGPAYGQCFSTGLVSQPGNGYLYLQLRAQAHTCNGTKVADTASVVESNPHDGVPGHVGFSYLYGYMEWRAYVPGVSPKGRGCPKGGCLPDWPDLWSHWKPGQNEIDTMEGLETLGQACYHLHPPPQKEGPGGCESGSYAGWNTYETVRKLFTWLVGGGGGGGTRGGHRRVG